MAPNVTSTPSGIFDGDNRSDQAIIETPKKKYKKHIIWRNVIIFSYLHLAAIYGLYLVFTSAQFKTTLFGK